MGKFTDLSTNVLSLFGTDGWKAEGVKTFPSNFIANNTGLEFIRINVIPGNTGINFNSVSGILIIEIFTAAGKGPTGAVLIADKLDTFLQGKTLGHTQLNKSTMSPNGVDRDDSSLFKSTYTIPFNYFGVN